MADDVLNVLRALGCSIEPCGSRVTCDPAPADTDQDYLVEMQPADDIIAKVVSELVEAGFVWEGNEHYQQASRSGFMSWRLDDVNLIVTADRAFAGKHRVATALCKRLNLLNKPDRIAAFQAVLYSNEWNGTTTGPVDPAAVQIEEIAF